MCRNTQRHCAAFRFASCLWIAIIFLTGIVSAQQPQSEKMDTFAKCLTKKNAVMYGSFLCSHCDDQRKLFGDSFKYIHYVEYSQNGLPQDVNACKFAQVRFTPTWILANGERLVGIQQLKQLSDKTGCILP
jgi:hypothetical protein